MSYINEALKKAQKDKDTGYLQYSGVFTTGETITADQVRICEHSYNHTA